MDFFSILKSSPLPQHEIEILLSFLLNKEREFLITHPESKIEKKIYQRFKILEKKRLANWSVAALIGKKEFYGLSFKVDKNVLIPRPESEMIVEEVLNLAKDSDKKLMIIDLGTGSGAIIIAVAAELKKTDKDKYTKTIFRAIDISKPALKIARFNSLSNKCGNKIKFLAGNLLEPLITKIDFEGLNERQVIISANLPYLTPMQIKKSPSIQKEPKLALVAGKDGLKYYRKLFKQMKILNVPAKILCEIDPSQNKSIKILAKKYLPSVDVKIKKDLAGLYRLAIIKTQKNSRT